MKKFITYGFVFFVIFFVAEKGFYYFLNNAPKKEYDKRLQRLIEGKINKDVIVIGSSRGASNIDARKIARETGLSTYNLSYPGSNVIFHEFILKTLVEFNNEPKKVILVIDNPYEFIEVETLKFRFERLQPLAKYNYINNELIKQKENSILSNYFCLARLKRSSFNPDKKYTPKENPIDSFGSMLFLNKNKEIKKEYIEDVDNYLISEELTDRLIAFKSIQKICKLNKIDLIFVFSPSFQKFNTSFKNRFDKLVLSGNKTMVYDTLNHKYRDKDYFYDASHLMQNGATVFTKEIITFLNKIN